MKILLINNFYYNRGGDCTYMFSLQNLLERKGHKVVIFSMHHPQNYQSDYSDYFVSYINYAEMAKNMSLSLGFSVLYRSIYSLEAKRKIVELIQKEKPDIAHLNNIRQHITTSILTPLKENGIPIIWTLHDYQLICPNISFLANGKICEKCKTRKYYWPVIAKCKKNSFLASAMAAVEHSAQMISGKYNLIDVFICPSMFLKNKFIEYGFNERKLIHLNYLIDIPADDDSRNNSDFCLYAGRISEEKGVKTLIDAVQDIDAVKFKIAGDGPLKEELILYAKSKNLDNRIEFIGYKNHEEILKLIKQCRFVVVPSEWYENYPYAVLEAFAFGKAVLGSDIGGIPELVKDRKTGLLFECGNPDDLRAKIIYMLGNSGEVQKWGNNAREFIMKELNADKHYESLMKIYKKVINKTEGKSV